MHCFPAYGTLRTSLVRQMKLKLSLLLLGLVCLMAGTFPSRAQETSRIQVQGILGQFMVDLALDLSGRGLGRHRRTGRVAPGQRTRWPRSVEAVHDT